MTIELWFFGLGWISGFFCMGLGLIVLKLLDKKVKGVGGE